MCEVTVSDTKARLPWVALSATGDTGAGSSTDLGGVTSEVTGFIVTTGSPSSGSVKVEGSHDGTNWFTLCNFSLPFNGNPVTASGGHLARYIRANLTSIGGGSSPTVAVTVAVGRVI